MMKGTRAGMASGVKRAAASTPKVRHTSSNSPVSVAQKTSGKSTKRQPQG